MGQLDAYGGMRCQLASALQGVGQRGFGRVIPQAQAGGGDAAFWHHSRGLYGE